MSPIIEFIKTLVPHIPTQQELDEAYLNASIDACDVERRMWEIDHRVAPSQPNTEGLGGALH